MSGRAARSGSTIVNNSPRQNKQYRTQQPSSLPEGYWNDLQKIHQMHVSYPGHGIDMEAARKAFQSGVEEKFLKAVRKLRDKQQVYEEYRNITRQNALTCLELAYPGCDADKEKLQAWCEKHHPSTDDNDIMWEDMMDGLRNKDALFFRDRSHPNVQELDALDLDYPGWERDLQEALDAHCSRPALLFPDMLHMLKEKQNMYVGNESHWRLQKLRDLDISYPHHEKDIQQIKEWHIRNADNAKNAKLFEEVLDAMREEQQLFLDMMGETNKDSVRLVDTVPFDSDTETTCSTQAKGSFYGIEVLQEANEMEKLYESISQALNVLAGQKHRLAVERSTDSSLTEPSSQKGDSKQDTEAIALCEDHQRIDFGKCSSCDSRSKTHAFVPCGHLCVCASCAHNILRDTSCCPICRSDSSLVMRVKVT
ncbi:MAG: hypothetical protein SGILL_001339 [Bacillariaceae sp.]